MRLPSCLLLVSSCVMLLPIGAGATILIESDLLIDGGTLYETEEAEVGHPSGGGPEVTVTVRNAGTVWRLVDPPGSLARQDLTVGQGFPRATVVVEQDGRVEALSVRVGDDSNHDAELIVDGATVDVQNRLEVANRGLASVRIENGAVVTVGNDVGVASVTSPTSDGVGQFLVTGSGTRLEIVDRLTVGLIGDTGTRFEVADGAYVSFDDANVGEAFEVRGAGTLVQGQTEISVRSGVNVVESGARVETDATELRTSSLVPTQMTVQGADSVWSSRTFLSIPNGSQAGIWNVSNGGALEVAESMSLRAGTIDTSGGGTVTIGTGAAPSGSAPVTVNAGGVLEGVGGTIVGDVVSRGLLRGTERTFTNPGTGTLTIDGNLALETGGEMRVEIESDAPGDDYAKIVVTGTATVGGLLTISLLDDVFDDIGSSDVFVVLDAGSVILGTYDNVTNGGTVAERIGGIDYTFSVHYGASSAFAADQVVLSDFVALVPEPGTALLVVVAAVALALRRSRPGV